MFSLIFGTCFLDFAQCGSWEAAGGHARWPDFPIVCTELAKEMERQGIRAALPCAGSLTVFYVCGFDHFNKCGLQHGLFSGFSSVDQGVVVLPRGGARAKDEPERRVFAAGRSPPDISSTLVRKHLAKGLALEGLRFGGPQS